MNKIKKVLTGLICLLSPLALVSCEKSEAVKDKKFYVEHFKEIEEIKKKEIVDGKETGKFIIEYKELKNYFNACYKESDKDKNEKVYCTAINETVDSFIFANNLAYYKVKGEENKEVLKVLNNTNFTVFNNFTNLTADNNTFVVYSKI